LDTGLKDKRVLVTGGSGGIGSACVRLFAGEGAHVVTHYHRARERAEAAGGAAVVQADLRDEADVAHMFAEAGELDVCVANAGVWPEPNVPVSELTLERFRETVDQNLTATFLTARGFLAQLGEREGSLVLVGSTAGIFGEAGHADYAAAKSAILGGLLLSMKNEVVRRNARTRVNAVAPGWTFTAMSDAVLDEAKVAEVTATMALRKVASAEDIASQILALASPTISGHVTGQVVTVAGGMEGRLIHPPKS
jgi:3-oxoacyl-[acyl-carrier protein] reductase